MDNQYKNGSLSFGETSACVNGKRIVDFAENCTLTELKKFVHKAYLSSQSVWLITMSENSLPMMERVWICKFDWERESFCVINPNGNLNRNPSGVVVVNIEHSASVRIGLAWAFVERQQSVLHCYFLGSDFSRPANFPENNRIFRFNALLDQSGSIVDPHFDKCKIPSYEESLRKVGNWAPEGTFNYDIRKNSLINVSDHEYVANNCQMAVFEQLKTAGYIAFANFKQFCVECEVPEDFVKVPTSTLEMNPTQCKKFFAGTVDVVDCNLVLEWQSDRAGHTSRVTLGLQCNDQKEEGSSPGPPSCHISFDMSYYKSDATSRVFARGHVLIDSAPEVDTGLHSTSADSCY